MSPFELAKAAGDALNRGLQNVQLVLPRKGTGRRYMRLAGRHGPLCEVACENADGHTVVWAPAMDVLAWLAAQGLIEVKSASADSTGVEFVVRKAEDAP
jgi:hypothetical protein